MIICIELNVEAFNPYIAPLRHIVNLHLITKIQISMGSQVMLCADLGEGCSPQKRKNFKTVVAEPLCILFSKLHVKFGIAF